MKYFTDSKTDCTSLVARVISTYVVRAIFMERFFFFCTIEVRGVENSGVNFEKFHMRLSVVPGIRKIWTICLVERCPGMCLNFLESIKFVGPLLAESLIFRQNLQKRQLII